MCGIVGTIQREGSVLDGIVTGLSTLEYRGYDSAGVALFLDPGIGVRKRAGRLSSLVEALARRTQEPEIRWQNPCLLH